MIERPAWATGYQFDAHFVDKILQQTAQEPGTLPMVAYALKLLYEHPRGQTFTREAYDAMNGVAGAIGTQADRVVGSLEKEARHAFERVFAELVHVEHGRPSTRKRVLLTLFKDDEGAKKLIDALAGPKCRVLVTSGDGDDALIEVAHEKLFTAWPLLKNYVADHQKQLMDKALLESRAQKWDEMGKPWLSGLASGRERKDFRKAGILTDLTSQYLNASLRGQVIKNVGVMLPLAFMLLAGRWLSSQDLKLNQAFLKAQSMVMSIHLEPVMKQVPGGSFRLGYIEKQRSDELPLRAVTINSFLIGQTEVTFEEYDRFVIATGREFPHDKKWGRRSRPVINVSWNDASDYAEWLSEETGKPYRLPTEAEWEYAIRKGDVNPVLVGASDEQLLKDYAVFNSRKTAPVGENAGRKSNALGLFDMRGNVWEWVEDCFKKDYKEMPSNGSIKLEPEQGVCAERVVRGGAWIDTPSALSLSYRSRSFYDDRRNIIGFRLVQDIP